MVFELFELVSGIKTPLLTGGFPARTNDQRRNYAFALRRTDDFTEVLGQRK